MSRFGVGFPSSLSGGNDSFTKVLLHMDGTGGSTSFIDSALGSPSKTWTSHGSGQFNTGAGPKFGTGYGASSWIDTPAISDFNIGTQDFAVDFWMNTNGFDLGALRYLAGQTDSALSGASTSWYILRTATNVVGAVIYQSSGTFAQIVTTTTHTNNQYRHVALVKSGTLYSMYIDGSPEGTPVTRTGAVNSSSNKLSVFRAGEFATGGYTTPLDEFRFSVGDPRFIAGFTPSSSAYT